MTDSIQKKTIDPIVQKYHKRLRAMQKQVRNTVIHDSLNTAYEAGRNRGTLAHPTYTRIDIEGRDGHYAILSRKLDSESIETEIFTPKSYLEFSVPVADYYQQIIGADRIYRELEGHDPTASDIDLYLRPFEHLSGNYNRGIEYEK